MNTSKCYLSFFLIVCTLFSGLAGCASSPTSTAVPATPTLSLQDVTAQIHWFGTSAFLYKGSKIIYFDPISLAGDLPVADLILVTHAHSDHWSVSDLLKISGPNTRLIISPNVSSYYEAAKSDLGIPATVLSEGQTSDVDGVSIQAVPAYGSGHPREAGGLGYIVGIDRIKMYMSGGTDPYPEMAQFDCDIAFIPIYSKALAQTLAETIPARLFILEHTSFYAAQAVQTLFTQDVGGGKTFVALQDGPYSP